jgi:hypothetical protein
MAYSTISKPSLHFNTKLYTGNGGTQSITGVGFQPDLVWCKTRSYNDDHTITDVIRGTTKAIFPNKSDGENTSSIRVTAFDSDGFTLGNAGDVNSNSATYVAWNFKAGGAGSANTDGTINSTVSANQTAGFSIVTYNGNGSSGATIGHGLGVAPEVVLVKKTNSGDAWSMLHPNVEATKYMRLDSDTGEVNDNVFNNTRAGNDVFTVDSDGQVNGNGNTFVAYCFKKKKGFFTTYEYTGNGNADGPFLYLGFKPAFVIIKRKTATNNWFMFDNKTSPRNPTNAYLRADTNGSAGSYDWLDLVSNGIKIRNTSNGANDSNQTYLVFAWAEEPLVANVGQSIPATAR